MSLGLVSPLLNRGVRSRWLASLPGAGTTKMLTIDSNGDTAFQDIPTAAWGSITGTLSSQTDLQNALNAKLSLSGGTVTGQLTNALGTITASAPLTLTQTWNNAAVTFNALSINATDTASASGSTLADLRIGNQEKFKVIAKGGSSVTRLELWSSYLGTPGLNWYAEVGHNSGYGGFVSCPGGYMESVNIDPGKFQYISSVASVNYRQWQMSVSGNVIKLSQGTTLEWYGADYRADTNTSDLVIRRDAAQTLAQRNGTNAQVFRVYNTFTDASNYERAKIAWESNVLRIGSEKAGTGSARAVEIQTDGTTRLTIASTGLGQATFTGTVYTTQNLQCDGDVYVANGRGVYLGTNRSGMTSSANGLIAMTNFAGNDFNRLQLGGTTSSFPAIKRNAAAINFRLADDSAACAITASEVSGSGWGVKSAAGMLQLNDGSGSVYAYFGSSTTQLNGQGIFLDTTASAHTWTNSGTRAMVHSPNNNVFEIRNSTNAQAFRVYNTYTDASNYERGKIEWSSNVLRIGTEKAGTGSARALELQTDGTTRLTVATNGNLTGAGLTLDNSNSQNIGLDVRPWITIKNNSATLAGYLSNGGSIFSSGASGTTDLGLRAVGAFGISVNNSQTPTITISSTSLVTIADASDIAVGTTTGTKIGTATTQKIGFYNKTPVVQPAAVADATDAASVITQLNLLLSRMRDLGLIAT